MDKPLMYVTRSLCDARPTITFPAAGYHRLLTGTKLCDIGTCACEQLAQGCYLIVNRLFSDVNVPQGSVATNAGVAEFLIITLLQITKEFL